MPRESARALAVTAVGVLLGSSTWLSGTAALPDLRAAWDLGPAHEVWLTLAVQIGFIVGTLVYSIFNIADVFNARRVFLLSAGAGAAFNAAFAWLSTGLASAVIFRMFLGITLAGVYPVGMKIVATWFRSGLGWRLGVLVGALTLGTAIPYLVQYIGADLPWRMPVTIASGLALAGGLLVAVAIGDGPYLRARAVFDVRMVGRVFREPAFRFTAFGYFGHMWELYAFWALAGAYLASRFEPAGSALGPHIPLIVFITIAAGALGCIAGGWLSQRVGERRIALAALIASAAMCALSGLAHSLPPILLAGYVVIWGVVVVADSPQFSALAARTCPPEYTGTALTAQLGIGFAVTLASIQLLPVIAGAIGWRWSLSSLALGPAIGAMYMVRLGQLNRRGGQTD